MALITTGIRRLISPVSSDPDDARRERVLNILLVGAMGMIASATFLNVIVATFGLSDAHSYQHNSVPVLFECGSLLGLTLLLLLSRRGHHISASIAFIGTFFTLYTYLQFMWGTDVAAAIFMGVFIILLSGMLLGASITFAGAALVSVVMIWIGTLHLEGIILPDRGWTQTVWEGTDMIMASVLYALIATMTWLAIREIERALVRARASEAALKEERDLLEVRVFERTRELREAEMEKMEQSYRFVEFGRLASGFFHDLANPLTALSLNIENIARNHTGQREETITKIDADIKRAQLAAAHMHQLMEGMRRHLLREGKRARFCVKSASEDLIRVLTTYARERDVTLSFVSQHTELEIVGDEVSFTQMLTNVISNAIESYLPDDGATHRKREVRVMLSREGATACIAVSDNGSGISHEVRAKIFEPFFSTKAKGGLGIGLPLAKRVAEKDFGGTIAVESIVGVGSIFTIHLPLDHAS